MHTKRFNTFFKRWVQFHVYKYSDQSYVRVIQNATKKLKLTKDQTFFS